MLGARPLRVGLEEDGMSTRTATRTEVQWHANAELLRVPHMRMPYEYIHVYITELSTRYPFRYHRISDFAR